MRPRIVVDARMAMDGGIGTYLQELVPRIAQLRGDWSFALIGDSQRLRSLGWGSLANADLVHCTAPIFSVREQGELPLRIDSRATLYWAPNYDVPVLSRTPMVVTIHDVNHVALPALLGGHARRLYARWMLETAVKRARHVLFDSEFSRAEATRLLGPSRTPSSVIYLGVDDGWARSQALYPERPLSQGYLLYVGNIKKHKNVPFLLRAFGRITGRISQRLLLIGRTEGLRADPAVASTLAVLGDRAQLLGELPAAEVRRYVAHADAVVTASLYEGFGLPALEAMAAGTPCLVSDAGSLPEVCGEAALYGSPTDESDFAEQLARIASDAGLQRQLVSRGRARAAQFSWDRTAQQTAAVLDAAL